MAQRSLVVQSAAAGAHTIAWTVERDCFLIGSSSFNGTAIVSDDPSVTSAGLSTPTADFSGEKFIYQPGTLALTAIPLIKGTKIYFIFSAKETVILFLDDAI